MIGSSISTSNINPDELSELQFDKVYPLMNVLQKASLLQKIYSAIMYGQSGKNKAVLTFNTLHGYKKLESTILSKNHDWLMLKGGRYIPIQSILNIEITL